MLFEGAAKEGVITPLGLIAGCDQVPPPGFTVMLMAAPFVQNAGTCDMAGTMVFVTATVMLLLAGQVFGFGLEVVL